MRIQGAYANKGVAGGRSSSRARGSGASFSVPQSSAETTGTTQAQSTSNVQSVDALLALQSIDDSLQGKKRKAVRRGNKMLDMLEDIRLGLLSGSLSTRVLQQLERLCLDVEASGDPRIDAVLDDINLRAQVELAKLEVRSSRKPD